MHAFLRSGLLRGAVLLAAAAGPLSLRADPAQARVEVTNPAGFARAGETVEVSLPDLAAAFGAAPPARLAVLAEPSARILASQVYASHPGGPSDRLLFQADFGPGETRRFLVRDAAGLALPPAPLRTFARYVPERMDDFAWESDRIAFRMFGQALIKGEGTISSGVDVWIKKNHVLVVNKMYRERDYHRDNGSEMDDYRVGFSRGCGGLGIWDGRALHVSSNYRTWRLIATGPIRSEFELTYDPWDAGGGRKVSETKRIRIDAGSNLSRFESVFASDDPAPLTVAVGLAERPGDGVVDGDREQGWLAYWQPRDGSKGTIAVALVLPRGAVRQFTNDRPGLSFAALHAPVRQPTYEGAPAIRDLLAVVPAEIGRPLVYYAGAAWDRSGDFPTPAAWENYVRLFARRRDAPLRVAIED